MAVMQYKYMFIKQWIIDQINSGVFQPGDALPSEYELCQQFSVSRQTARNALDMLVSEGIIQREQGRGTFVKSTLNRNRNRTVRPRFGTAGSGSWPRFGTDGFDSEPTVSIRNRY